MSDLSQKDAIVIDAVGTNDETVWITIKDASDLLGCSERHIWRVARTNGWETRKLLNIARKKTFLLRSDVEKFYNEERERQKLEALKNSSSDTSDMSDKKGKNDMSDSSTSDILKAMSDKDHSQNLPAVLSEYKLLLTDYQRKQDVLTKKASFWRASTLWAGILTGCLVFVLGLWLSDTKNALSDSKTALSDKERLLSDKEKALFVAERGLSETQKTLEATQKELTGVQTALAEKNAKLTKLEGSLSNEHKE